MPPVDAFRNTTRSGILRSDAHEVVASLVWWYTYDGTGTGTYRSLSSALVPVQYAYTTIMR